MMVDLHRCSPTRTDSWCYVLGTMQKRSARPWAIEGDADLFVPHSRTRSVSGRLAHHQ